MTTARVLLALWCFLLMAAIGLLHLCIEFHLPGYAVVNGAVIGASVVNILRLWNRT